MIFVTVGTHDQGFERLVKATDELAELVQEEVIVQRGCTKYEPIHAKHFRYADSHHITELIYQARVVISQASAGTIIAVFTINKPLIVIPRLKRLKENWTDHQIELAKALDDQGRALAILSEEINGIILLNAIERVRQSPPLKLDQSTQLIRALKMQLNAWENKKLMKNMVRRKK